MWSFFRSLSNTPMKTINRQTFIFSFSVKVIHFSDAIMKLFTRMLFFWLDFWLSIMTLHFVLDSITLKFLAFEWKARASSTIFSLALSTLRNSKIIRVDFLCIDAVRNLFYMLASTQDDYYVCYIRCPVSIFLVLQKHPLYVSPPCSVINPWKT